MKARGLRLASARSIVVQAALAFLFPMGMWRIFRAIGYDHWSSALGAFIVTAVLIAILWSLAELSDILN